MRSYDLHVFHYAWGCFSNPTPVYPALVQALVLHRKALGAI
jgi:hypothetical protein